MINEQILKKLNLRIYQPNMEQDLHLLNWWVDLNTTGDLAELILPGHQHLSAFLDVFKPPTILIYSLTNNKITCANWFTPFDSAHPAVFYSLWAAKNIRHNKKTHQVFYVSQNEALNYYNTLLAVTRQKNIKQFAKANYSQIGVFPLFFENEDGYLLQVSKEAFQSSDFTKLILRSDVI